MTKARTVPARRYETGFLSEYLESLSLPVKPVVHVNGHSYASCLVTVDFGTPLNQSVKLTPDQVHEMQQRLRKLARDVLGREANIRISHDGQNGIYWTSVA